MSHPRATPGAEIPPAGRVFVPSEAARRRRLRRVGVPVLSLGVLVAAGLLGGPWLLGATGLAVSGGAPTIDPIALGYVTPPAQPTPRAGELAWPPVQPGALVDADQLAARLDAVTRSGVGRVSYTVLDPWTLTPLVEVGAHEAMVPASNMKLLTAAAVLAVYGPEHRFTTQVVGGGDHLVLVGGGDPYLSGTASDYPQRASLADLAQATAQALAATGQTSVTLDWDASYFAGASWHPSWPRADIAYVGPTAALWVDRGWSGATHVNDPAQAAARVFADRLREAGIEVSWGGTTTVDANAVSLAQIKSAPLSLIVQEMLRYSDNDAAEALFRLVARGRGGDGSLASAQQILPQVLGELGLWEDGLVADDGSGMSSANRVTAAVIARSVALGFADPRYRALVTGLPTAGSDGSLDSGRRYDDQVEYPARGLVRAKTGTLDGVHCLGGMAQTRGGGIVVFAFLANDSGNDAAAVDWLDTVTAVLVG